MGLSLRLDWRTQDADQNRACEGGIGTVACATRSCLKAESGSGFNTDNVESFYKLVSYYQNIAGVNKTCTTRSAGDDATERGNQTLNVVKDVNMITNISI